METGDRRGVYNTTVRLRQERYSYGVRQEKYSDRVAGSILQVGEDEIQLLQSVV